MGNQVYPHLVGEGWPIVKRPRFSTIVQTAASGRQTRIANYPHPLWEWEIPYQWLSSAGANLDLQILMGFYAARTGSFDSFLYDDVSDNLVAGQPIATGDGSTRAFQMQRTLGASVEPVFDVNGIAASYPAGNAPARAVYLNGASQGSGWTIDTAGILTFGSAPGSGLAITADFGYFWRCHFLDDNMDFSEFASAYWEAQKVAIGQVRV